MAGFFSLQNVLLFLTLNVLSFSIARKKVPKKVRSPFSGDVAIA